MRRLAFAGVLVISIACSGCGGSRSQGAPLAHVTSHTTPHTASPADTSGQVASSTPTDKSAPASSAGRGPAEISSCGLEAGIVGSANVRLHGVAPGDYIVYVNFIEDGVFVERVPIEVELAASGEQRYLSRGSGGHRLPAAPKCEVDSVFTLPSDPNTPRMEIWKSAVYASQTPEYSI